MLPYCDLQQHNYLTIFGMFGKKRGIGRAKDSEGEVEFKYNQYVRMSVLLWWYSDKMKWEEL